MAPVANDDTYQTLQDTTLTVDNQRRFPDAADFRGLKQVRSFGLAEMPIKLEYSAAYERLYFLENQRIRVFDAQSGNLLSSIAAEFTFTDLDTTYDGRFLFVADYGGTQVGQGIPTVPSQVHRFDAITGEWVSKTMPGIAYRLEAVDAERVILQGIDQWVDVTLVDWGQTNAAPALQIATLPLGYSGDIELDVPTGRLFKSDSGIRPSQVYAYRLLEGNFVFSQTADPSTVGAVASAPSVLGADGRYYYYGTAQMSATKVSNFVQTFPEPITTAGYGVAFGNQAYYSEESGARLGQLPFPVSAIVVSEQSSEVWVYEESGRTLQLFSIPHLVVSGVLINDTGIDVQQTIVTIVSGPTHGQLKMDSVGRFSYTPDKGFVGADNFSYRLTNSRQEVSNVAQVTLAVRPLNSAPLAVADRYTIPLSGKLTAAPVAAEPGSYRGLISLASLPTDLVVAQMEYASHARLLFVRDTSGTIHIIDSVSGRTISKRIALNDFTDLDLTADQKFLYVADYGGPATGVSTLSGPSYVHRFNLMTRQWESRLTQPSALRIEAIDGERLLLLGFNGTPQLHLLTWTESEVIPLTPLATVPFAYYGDIEYENITGRVLKGNSGFSSQEISAIAVVGNTLVSQEMNSPIGSAGSTAISAEGAYFYNGDMQVDARDLGGQRRWFPKIIYGGGAGIAFSENEYYSATTGKLLGSLDYSATSLLVAEDGLHLWTYHAAGKSLNFYRLAPLGWGVLSNDQEADDDRLTATLVQGPRNGSLTLRADGSFEYTANSAVPAEDEFTYRATDGFSQSNVETVTLVPASPPPVAIVDSYTGIEDASIVVDADQGLLVNDVAPDGTSLTAELFSPPANGTVEFRSDGTFVYRPNPNYSGTDRLSYRARDGELLSAPTTVWLKVLPIPDAPIGTDDFFLGSEDTTLGDFGGSGVLLNDLDGDRDFLTAILETSPQNGTLTLLPTGRFNYRPNPNFFGEETFYYRVSDGVHLSNPVKVTLQVQPINDVPVATPDKFVIGSNREVLASAGVLRNDTDLDGDKLSAHLMSLPQSGSIFLRNDGSFVYTPSDGFNGRDSFSYAAYDGTRFSDITTVELVSQLHLSIADVTVTTRAGLPMSGSFDVIMNLADDVALAAAGYQVVLRLPPQSGIIIDRVDSMPGETFFPNQLPAFQLDGDHTLLVFDYSASSGRPLQNGLGLFRVHFHVKPEVHGMFPITFDRELTTMVNAAGEPIPLMAYRPSKITVVDGGSPTVVEVAVKSTLWAASFMAEIQERKLGTKGFTLALNDGSPKPIPWSNLDQVVVRFSEPVDVSSNALLLTYEKSQENVVREFTYDPFQLTATWTFKRPFESGKVRINLDVNAIVDARQNRLFGNLTTGGAALFSARFDVLVGDVNRSEGIDLQDLGLVRQRMFQRIGQPRYSVFDDVDGSGMVDLVDLAKINAVQGQQIAAGKPKFAKFPLIPLASPTSRMPLTFWAGNRSRNRVESVDQVFSDVETLPSIAVGWVS